MGQRELRLEGVRCPWCGKFGGAASPGSVVELKCHSCKLVFRRQVPPAEGGTDVGEQPAGPGRGRMNPQY